MSDLKMTKYELRKYTVNSEAGASQMGNQVADVLPQNIVPQNGVTQRFHLSDVLLLNRKLRQGYGSLGPTLWVAGTNPVGRWGQPCGSLGPTL